MSSDDFRIGKEVKKLERYVRLIPAYRQLGGLGRVERDSLLLLSSYLVEVGKLINDAVATEDMVVRADGRMRAVAALDEFRKSLLIASQYELVDAADVAELSALGDQIIDAINSDISAEWQQ